MVLRDLDGRMQWQPEKDLPVQAGQAEIAVSLPALAAGEYLFDAWLLHHDDVVDWGSAHFTVIALLVLDLVRFTELARRRGLDRKVAEC